MPKSNLERIQIRLALIQLHLKLDCSAEKQLKVNKMTREQKRKAQKRVIRNRVRG